MCHTNGSAPNLPMQCLRSFSLDHNNHQHHELDTRAVSANCQAANPDKMLPVHSQCQADDPAKMLLSQNAIRHLQYNIYVSNYTVVCVTLLVKSSSNIILKDYIDNAKLSFIVLNCPHHLFKHKQNFCRKINSQEILKM